MLYHMVVYWGPKSFEGAIASRHWAEERDWFTRNKPLATWVIYGVDFGHSTSDGIGLGTGSKIMAALSLAHLG